jgi:uncharacterized membrane protein
MGDMKRPTQLVEGLSPLNNLILLLACSNAMSLVFYVLRVLSTGSLRYWYLSWNLFLALVPIFFAWLLIRRLKTHRWLEPGNITLTALWLGFLPNSFYVLTDFIHLRDTGEINLLFDIVLIFSFTVNAFIAGYLSVYMIHRELLKRKSVEVVSAVIATVFALCGFAIYLGRTLRWNTWDIVLNPFGLLFDVSEGLLNPLAHPQMLVTTGIFFILLSTSYALIYGFTEVIRLTKSR